MIRVVLDTNVLVAAVICPTGPNAQIFQAIVADRIRPYVTNVVIEEYDRVFEYGRLQHLDKRRVANVRRLLKVAAIKVHFLIAVLIIPWCRNLFSLRSNTHTCSSASAKPRRYICGR